MTPFHHHFIVDKWAEITKRFPKATQSVEITKFLGLAAFVKNLDGMCEKLLKKHRVELDAA